MRVGIVGGGHLGLACAQGLLRVGLSRTQDITIIETLESRRFFLQSQFPEISVIAGADKTLQQAQVVFLCVKPQEAALAIRAVANFLSHEATVISPMAGFPLARLSAALPEHARIVRCMPNLGAQFGLAITPFVLAPKFPQEERALVEGVLTAFGSSFEVSREDLIDAATAVSGSGPAYVYYFIEHLQKSARELGFSDDEAQKLVNETFRAAIESLYRSAVTPRQLRERVTSKGGTTEAALHTFDAGKLGEVIADGVRAAYARAKDLSRQRE